LTDCNNCDFDKYCTRDTCIDDTNPQKDILEERLEEWEELNKEIKKIDKTADIIGVNIITKIIYLKKRGEK